MSVEAFGVGVNFFWNLYSRSDFFGISSKKTLSWEIIFRVVTTAMRAYRGIFWGKKKCLKQSYFCSSVLKFEQFFCLLTKKSWCQRNNLLLQKKKEENVCTKIVFYSNQFRISSRIVRTLRQKILTGLSKLHSKSSEEQF